MADSTANFDSLIENKLLIGREFVLMKNPRQYLRGSVSSITRQQDGSVLITFEADQQSTNRGASWEAYSEAESESTCVFDRRVTRVRQYVTGAFVIETDQGPQATIGARGSNGHDTH